MMIDLLALAFQTDSTRVATLLLALEQSPRAYPEIGIPEAHHGLTHHQGDADKIAKVIQINQYHMKQFVYLVDKFKKTPDGDGTLLDHAMVTYGSGLSDGNAHDHANLPMGGGGGGWGRGGRGGFGGDVNGRRVAIWFRAMLDRMGVPAETLGDGTGKLGYLSDL